MRNATSRLTPCVVRAGRTTARASEHLAAAAGSGTQPPPAFRERAPGGCAARPRAVRREDGAMSPARFGQAGWPERGKRSAPIRGARRPEALSLPWRGAGVPAPAGLAPCGGPMGGYGRASLPIGGRCAADDTRAAGPAPCHYRFTGSDRARRKLHADCFAGRFHGIHGAGQPDRGVRHEWWRVTEAPADRCRRGLPATLRGLASPMRDTTGLRATTL